MGKVPRLAWLGGFVVALLGEGCVATDPDHCANNGGDAVCGGQVCNKCVSSESNRGCVDTIEDPRCYFPGVPQVAGTGTVTGGRPDNTTTSPGGSTAADGADTLGVGATAGATDTTSADSDTGATTGGGACVDGVQNGRGDNFECSTWTQDCPGEGDKCVAWGSNGIADSTACFEMDPTPGGVGGPCTGGLSGDTDSCGPDSMCYTFTSQPVCLAFCDCKPGENACNDSSVCMIANGGALALCHPLCDPLAQNCGPTEGCYLFDTGDPGFVCSSDASGPKGDQGYPCSFPNSCTAGLACAPEGAISGCPSAQCCAAICDLTDDNCRAGLSCQPWFGVGEAPPGQENIGFCG